MLFVWFGSWTVSPPEHSSSHSNISPERCILNLKFIFLPPPTPLNYIFSPTVKFEKFPALFFCNFVYFKSIGEKYAFSPFLFIPFQYFFFPQPVVWPYFCPKKNIHPWRNVVYFLPIGGKNMHLPPFYLSPFNNFFPPSCCLAIFAPRKIYTHEEMLPVPSKGFSSSIKTAYSLNQTIYCLLMKWSLFMKKYVFKTLCL